MFSFMGVGVCQEQERGVMGDPDGHLAAGAAFRGRWLFFSRALMLRCVLHLRRASGSDLR